MHMLAFRGSEDQVTFHSNNPPAASWSESDGPSAPGILMSSDSTLGNSMTPFTMLVSHLQPGQAWCVRPCLEELDSGGADFCSSRFLPFSTSCPEYFTLQIFHLCAWSFSISFCVFCALDIWTLVLQMQSAPLQCNLWWYSLSCPYSLGGS